MNGNPTVSVIIPTLPERKLLCMDTLKHQTYKALEILIAQDHDHRGPAKIRNELTVKASGEYVLHLDDDMLLYPHMIQMMVHTLELHPEMDFTYCNYLRISGGLPVNFTSGHWDPVRLKLMPYIDGKAMLRADRFRPKPVPSQPGYYSPVVPFWDPEIKRMMDWDFFLQALSLGYQGKWIDAILFASYYDGNTISEGSSDDFEYWYRHIRKKHGLDQRQERLDDRT